MPISDSTVNYLLKESKVFCVLPWVHLNINRNGFMNACCSASDKNIYHFGNVKKSSIRELWQGTGICDFRKKMLCEESNPLCQMCYDYEKLKIGSPRIEANKSFEKYSKWIKTSNLDSGFAPNAKPIYWEIRFSNKCNLRCRTCSHYYSSLWYKEDLLLNKITDTTENTIVTCSNNQKNLLDELEKIVDDVEYIYFVGGEPLISDEHHHILQILNKNKQHNVDLLYNTNLTNLNYNGIDICELWSKFNNVNVLCSIDDSQKRGEYIRHGSHWKAIVDNRRKINNICSNVNVLLNPTFSVYNAWHLTDFHKEWVGLGFDDIEDIKINILDEPAYLSARILPDDFKIEVSNKIEKHIQWMKENSLKKDKDRLDSVIMNWKELLVHMQSKRLASKISEFYSISLKLDTLRCESFHKTFPELSILSDDLYKNIIDTNNYDDNNSILMEKPNVKQDYLVNRNSTFIISKKHFTSDKIPKKIRMSISRGKEEIELYGEIKYPNQKIELKGWSQIITVDIFRLNADLSFSLSSPIPRFMTICWWFDDYGKTNKLENNIVKSKILKNKNTLILNPMTQPIIYSIESNILCLIDKNYFPKDWKPMSIVIQIAIKDTINKKLNGSVLFNNNVYNLSGWYTDIKLASFSLDENLCFNVSLPTRRKIQIIWWCE